jgi:hypothetical protein
MKYFQKKHIFILISFFLIGNVFAQKDKDNLGTEIVNVVKPYAPSVSDATKIEEVPSLDDAETTKQEKINYSIVSIPVASTFTPNKGTAATIERKPKEILFDNYATLGFGSYASIVGGLFVTHKLSNSELISGMFNHNSSSINIKNTELNSTFSDTKANVNYSNKLDQMNWTANVGFQNQVYNWYGLPTNFGLGLIAENRSKLLENINPKHTFNDFAAQATANFNDNIFQKIELQFNRFWDNYKSTENYFQLKPTFQLDVADNAINLKTNIQYIGTSFERFYHADLNNMLITNFQNQNSYFSISANPNYTMLRDDLTINLGAEFTFLNAITNRANGTDFGNKSSIYIYPKITASYKVVGNLMIAFGGAEGGLNHNSYRNLANQNNFLSPTLSLSPTDTAFDVYVGLRGKLANNLSYNVKASYLNEQNKALFRSNFHFSHLNNTSYENGNSFTVVYDNIKTLRFDGAINSTISEIIDFGVHGGFSSFSNSFQNEVWNLPTLEFDATIDMKLNKKWSAGSKIFFVGERKDQVAVMNPTFSSPPTYSYQTVKLDGFFDVNFNVLYKHNDRLSGFFKANNITNQAYERWLNFRVQQLQLTLGANYKFDF